MKKLVLMIIIAMFQFLLYANADFKQTIRGNITEDVTGIPIAGAMVILAGSEPIVGTTSDVNGEFELKNVPIGRQSIEVSFIGFETVNINNLLLSSGKEVILNIKLVEKVMQVEEVTVKAFNRKDQSINKMAMVSARTFTVEETERFAGSLGDPARMVANYAGVMTQNDARNDIIIRGNSPMGLLWKLDGIEIPNPNHFGALGTTGGPVSMLNNNLLTNSDFLTGAFPAEYGNAMAGVFDLRMRQGNNAKTEFTGQVGFNGFEAGLEGPLDIIKNGPKASYIANFRYSTLEVMDKIGFNMGTGMAIPQYKDFTFKLDLPGTKYGLFKVIGLWGKSYIELGREIGDTTENSYNPIGTATNFGSDLGMAGLSHTYFFGEDSRLTTIVSFQNTKSTTKVDSISFQDENVFEKLFYGGIMDESKISVNTSFKHKFSSSDNLEIGASYDFYFFEYNDSVFSNENNQYRPITGTSEDLDLIRGYSQWQHKFNDRFTANLGLHYTYFPFTGENIIEPRAGLRWQFNDKQNITAGFGMHSQMQPRMTYFYETFIYETGQSLLTNKALEFSKSHHYVLGYNYLFNNNFRFRAETYYQGLYNIPVKESKSWYSILNSGDNFGVYTEDSLTNKGKGRNYGIELTLEKFFSKGYYFLVTASIFDSKYKGYEGDWRNTAFNGNYVFNALGGYEFKVGKESMITIDLKTVWAGGKRYIPLDLDESAMYNEARYNFEDSYKNRYDDYLRTDVRIGFKMNKAKYSQEWGLDLQNVMGYQSVFMEGYDAGKGEPYKTYQQGFFPMMLYRIQF